MSSIPGYTLEALVAWNFNLSVEDSEEYNFSLCVAETLGNISKRPMLTREQFSNLIAYFESHREHAEYLLHEFDPEYQSWRTYGGLVFDFVFTNEADSHVTNKLIEYGYA